MEETEQVSRVTINVMRGCLVATIQIDLDRRVLEQLRKDILGRLEATRLRRIILDCSGIEIMDGEDFAELRRIIAMSSLMGANTTLAGLQPGVVSALIDLDADLDGLQSALSLDDAFERIERQAEDVQAIAEDDPNAAPQG